MLINLRNALLGGKRLPYDAESEYLESTGTQWIATGINVSTVSNNLRVRGLVKFTNLSAGEHDVLGSGNSRTPTMGRNGARYFMWAEISTSWYPASCDMNWHELDFSFSNPSGRTFSVDGSSYSTSSANKFFGTDLYLFTSGPGRYPVSCQIGHIQIFIDNALVRDYIPVRKGTTGELYDRVSGKFAERHGDFVLGPDVVPVEYIESHGTEYINTGVVPTSLTKWDIDAQFTSSDYGQIMGRGGDPALNPRFAFGLDIRSGGHGLTWYCGMGNVNTWNGIFDTFRHAFSLDALHKTFTIDTTSYNVPLSSIGDTTIMQLFARFVNGRVQNFCKAKIFKSSIIDNGLPVRSFLPIRVGTGSTWEGAMMDVLTRRIYRNAGTGAFSYGNDLKYPIPA